MQGKPLFNLPFGRSIGRGNQPPGEAEVFGLKGLALIAAVAQLPYRPEARRGHGRLPLIVEGPGLPRANATAPHNRGDTG